MRSPFYLVACLAVIVSCRQQNQPASPNLESILASGSLRYQAMTPEGRPLLVGRFHIQAQGDSAVTGTWNIEWVPGADTTYEVGDQIGSGSLRGRRTENGLTLDLNPGFADNNVILVATPEGWRLAGDWHWSTFVGPRSGGRFSLE